MEVLAPEGTGDAPSAKTGHSESAGWTAASGSGGRGWDEGPPPPEAGGGGGEHLLPFREDGRPGTPAAPLGLKFRKSARPNKQTRCRTLGTCGAVRADPEARPRSRSTERKEPAEKRQRRCPARPLPNTPRSPQAPAASSPGLRSSGHQGCRALARSRQAAMTAARLNFQSCSGARAEKTQRAQGDTGLAPTNYRAPPVLPLANQQGLPPHAQRVRRAQTHPRSRGRGSFSAFPRNWGSRAKPNVVLPTPSP